MIGSGDRQSRVAGAGWPAGCLRCRSIGDRASSRPTGHDRRRCSRSSITTIEIEQLAAMDALGLAARNQRRRARSPSGITSIATAAGARSPAARSKRWRASVIRRPMPIARQLAGDRWAEGKDATALAVAFARERHAEGRIDRHDPAGGSTTSRAATRRAATSPSSAPRAVILPVDFYRPPDPRGRARPDRQGPRLQDQGTASTAGAIVEVEAYIGEDDPGVSRRRRSDRPQRAALRPARPRIRVSELRPPRHDERGDRGGRASCRGLDPRARAARRTGADAPPPAQAPWRKGKPPVAGSRAVSRSRQSLPRDGHHARRQHAPANARPADDS